MNTVVLHYKELALKGGNRPWFTQALVRNLRAALADLEVRTIRSVMGRIEIELGSAPSSAEPRAPNPVWEEVRGRIRRVFGIANF